MLFFFVVQGCPLWTITRFYRLWMDASYELLWRTVSHRHWPLSNVSGPRGHGLLVELERSPEVE